MLHLNSAKVIGPHRLLVEFSTGEKKKVDVMPLLKGPIFRPLRNRGFFNLVKVDPECKTVTWPNGADLAPEALYNLRSFDSDALVQSVAVTDLEIKVGLKDGRKISVPLAWYPRLVHGTKL